MRVSFHHRTILPAFTLAIALLALVPGMAIAGKIVATNDEWQTTNFGFSQTPAGSTQFALNVAQWFTGSPNSGNFLVYSTNFSLDPLQATTLRSTVEGAGYTWTSYTSIPAFSFDLPTLLGFDGVFLALPQQADNSVLTAYVNAGGNVYVAAGTGIEGPAAEAAAWNTFLNAFGLQFEGSNYNAIGGNVPIQNPFGHPVLNGMAYLYQDNGNNISLFGSNPNARIIEPSGHYAVYESPTGIPEPGTSALLGSGLFGLLCLACRRSSHLGKSC